MSVRRLPQQVRMSVGVKIADHPDGSRRHLLTEEERVDRGRNVVTVSVGQLKAGGPRRADEVALKGDVGELRIAAIVGIGRAEDTVERVADARHVVEVADVWVEHSNRSEEHTSE